MKKKKERVSIECWSCDSLGRQGDSLLKKKKEKRDSIVISSDDDADIMDYLDTTYLDPFNLIPDEEGDYDEQVANYINSTGLELFTGDESVLASCCWFVSISLHYTTHHVFFPLQESNLVW